jgi:CheY-like chemotaxis protein
VTKRILVVDDEPCVLFVLRQSLATLNGKYQVATAGNAQEALDLLRQEDFDLVVTDLRMPGTDGIELTEAIRSLRLSPIVLWMTAHGCAEVKGAAQRLAVEMCLDKPLEVDAFRAAVAAAIDGGAAIRLRDQDGSRVSNGRINQKTTVDNQDQPDC